MIGAGATSTDALVDALSVAGAALGCDVVAVADWPPELSAPDGVLTTGRFGFFGAAAAADLSEPDFLSLTADFVVDFLPAGLPVSLEVSLPAELPLPLLLAPAPSPAGADWDDSVDDGACVSAPEAEPVEESDDESVDELVDPESVGPAHATPGVVATATPTPRATARPPTRPTYFACPITTPPSPDAKQPLVLQEHRQL
ncbi:hypothetical protein GGC64_000311 [Mycobacterium sp. OAS707]|uniref:hypothetical protein n=1 Tax=Mycobacterium sp. OAS707 TaxID=2663822 RepID=UPI00178AD94C|nr:hypothetical protein [Mycobacterium sp. OAS707]MBE1546303.1 hypothetical protein [Mycobacterium sp. OAS707]